MASGEDRLEWLWERQEEFQRIVRRNQGLRATSPKDLDDYDKMEFIREQSMALVAEVVEALEETGWKSWSKSNHLHRDRYLGELVDVLHFLANLCLVAGITPGELLDGYERKLERNFERQTEEYDGLRNKCPSCRRELDKAGALTAVRKPLPPSDFYCTACGQKVDPKNIDSRWLGVAR